MNDDVFAQMMEGLRSTTKSGGKKKQLSFDPPADPSAPVEMPETEIPPLQPGDPVDPNTFIGPPAPVQGVTGPAGPEGSPAVQGTVNRIDLNEPQAQQAQQAQLPPPAQMMPFPEPQPAEPAVHAEMGLMKKPSSTQRASTPRPAAQEQLGDVTSSTSKQETSVGPDSRMSSLGDRQKGIDQERMKSLEDAGKATDMSTEEMLAMALVTLLPTLVGGIAGGALAGKAGGAAGVAGGLTGGSQGLNNIITQKQKDKEAAMADAAKLGQRSDALEGEMGQRQGQLEAMAEHDKTRAANKDLTVLKEEGDTKRANAANATHLKGANIQAYAQLKATKMQTDARLQAAESKAEAAAKGTGATGEETNAMRYAVRMRQAEPIVRQHEAALASLGAKLATKSGWLQAISDPETREAADAAGRFMAAILRKESGAAIGEEEWASNYARFMPMLNNSAKEMATKRHARLGEVLTMSYAAGRAMPYIDKVEQQLAESIKQPGAQPQGGGQAPPAQNDKPLTSKWGAGR